MAGRRVNLAGLAAAPVETTPGHSKPTLSHLPPSQIAPTPLNPRRAFGTPEELAELGESMRAGQLQPCVAIPRTAYLKLWPEHIDQIPECRVVLAAGERRWLAARQVDLPLVDVLIREDIAGSREAFLAAVLKENLDRRNFDLIEQARGLQRMKDLAGDGARAAERLKKSKQWFSQNLGLLRLTEEMQALVSAGGIPFRDARRYASLPPEQQMPAWRADQEAAKQRQAEPRRKTEPPAASPPPAQVRAARTGPNDGRGYTAVYPTSGEAKETAPPAPITETPAAPPAVPPAVRTPVKSAEGSPPRDTTSAAPAIPPARAAAESDGLPRDNDGFGSLDERCAPWSDPEALGRLIKRRMRPDDLKMLIAELSEG